jgi:hypothetical protein
MTKQFINARIYKQDKQFFDTIACELTGIEKKKVTFPELQRRIKNMPNLIDTLRFDSRTNKRRVF